MFLFGGAGAHADILFLLDHADEFQHEFKLGVGNGGLAASPAASSSPAAAAGEEILLQGVVDCCFETADGLTVVDFKTDRVFSALEVRQRAEHYRPQLEAYSRALERVLEKKVVRRALYFLAAGETMEI